MDNKPVFYIMGVSGCGKTTVGKMLAKKLGIPFFDGDDFHPVSNIQKMKAGIPLNDADRHGWLLNLNALAKENSKKGVIIACSALKESYRRILDNGIEKEVVWVFLKGSFKTLHKRMENRKGHYMPPSLLKSQLDTLETPKHALIESITKTPETIVKEILDKYHKSHSRE
ncbi:gluconokinase [Flavobacteriaceae bacterium F89]|uniref:Gluconokinase n=1 Tax=Cerina litoralis TaxID=2874477 RepID=A0AAE3EVS1_9FLAO|nr:gluconokinase [Cerina litoralis]MCG2461109.1 gluconokinase [Cerina litoralis]